MKIAIFGASGVTGQHLINQSLVAGHHVTAMVRSPGSLTIRHPALEVLVGDFGHAASIEQIVAGQDVIVSVLGARKEGSTTICTDGVRAILAAMAATGTRRLIALSAYGASETKKASLFIRFIRCAIADKMRDKDNMEALVRASALDWTLVRPPLLTNREATGMYLARTDLKPGLTTTISRADMAGFILHEAVHNEFVGKAPVVAS